MKKLKDLIYDYNDIFVALLIVAIAGSVILWRVDTIMAYPQHVASNQPGAETDFSNIDLTPGTVEDFNENPEDVSSETDGQPHEPGKSDETLTLPSEAPGAQQDPAEGQQPAGTPGQTPDTAQPSGGTAAQIIVTIPSGSSGKRIAQILVQAGAVPGEEAFLEAVTAKKAETKLKAGTFTIPAGSTPADVVDIISR